MADKVKSVEQFSSAFHSAIAVEKSKRGLGKMFHEAVITLLNEHPDATADELVTLFRETLTEVENTLQGELKEAFGEDAEAKDLSSWTQYKSNYKRALEMVDRRDIMKCSGPYDLNMKLQEVRKALKEKTETGVSDAAPANEGGVTSSGVTDVGTLPAHVQAIVSEAVKLLAKLPEDAATEAADIFKNAAAARLRKLGHGKKKIGAVAGNSTGAKVAANH